MGIDWCSRVRLVVIASDFLTRRRQGIQRDRSGHMVQYNLMVLTVVTSGKTNVVVKRAFGWSSRISVLFCLVTAFESVLPPSRKYVFMYVSVLFSDSSNPPDEKENVNKGQCLYNPPPTPPPPSV